MFVSFNCLFICLFVRSFVFSLARSVCLVIRSFVLLFVSSSPFFPFVCSFVVRSLVCFVCLFVRLFDRSNFAAFAHFKMFDVLLPVGQIQ